MTAVAVAPNVAIFDFDGTIADSLSEVLAAYNAVANDLSLATISSQRLQELRRLGPREAMRELDVPFWKVPRIMGGVRSAMRSRIAHLQPIEGMSEALHQLWDRGIRTAIVSSNSRENVHEFLTRHGLSRFEALSCGASLFGKAKRLRRMALRLEFSGAHLFYVGDEVRDVSAAAEACISSVAVTWGYGECSALKAQRPDHLVQSPAQLVSILAPQGA